MKKQESVLLRVLVTNFSEEIDITETRIAGAEISHFKALAEDVVIPRAGQKPRLVSLASAILCAIAIIFAFPDIRDLFVLGIVGILAVHLWWRVRG